MFAQQPPKSARREPSISTIAVSSQREPSVQPVREAAPRASWDFSKIATFATDRAGQPPASFGPCCPGRLTRGLPAVASRARWSTSPTASQNAFLRCHPGPVPASIRQRSRGHAWRRSAGRSTGRIPLPPARTGGSVSLPDTISPTFPYIKMRQGFRRQLQLRIPRNSHLDSR